MFHQFVQYLKRRLFYIWLLVYAVASIFISPELSSVEAIFATAILLYLIYAFNQTLFCYFIGFITLSLSLYYPISLHYGALNSGIVMAFLETDMSESLSFLERLTFDDGLFPLFYVLSAIILLRLMKSNQPSPVDKKKRILFTALFATFVLVLLYTPTKFYFHSLEDDEDDSARWTLAYSPINIISFYANIYDSTRNYFVEKNLLENARTLSPPWQIISVTPAYQNYVLIIGESARRDYLSSYGFKLPTSPFLDHAKGYINSGYISAAPATYHSLLKTLYFKQGKKVNYAYNIITLAKGAGFQTEWFSNQGHLGRYDTIASRIGASADFTYFTKKGAFNTSHIDDFKLLDQIGERLTQNTTMPRLFVIHLMGSHQNFCDRLKDEDKKLTYINKAMSCYVNTILKTDRFIEQVIDLLKKQQQSYSLIYFSDHGLSYTNPEEKEKLNLDYDGKYKANYEVPFFKLSSDDTQRIVVNTKRSASNFIYGFAQWLGVVTEELSSDYHFFSSKNDEDIKVFNFEKNVYFDELDNEPLISIEE